MKDKIISDTNAPLKGKVQNDHHVSDSSRVSNQLLKSSSKTMGSTPAYIAKLVINLRILATLQRDPSIILKVGRRSNKGLLP